MNIPVFEKTLPNYRKWKCNYIVALILSVFGFFLALDRFYSGRWILGLLKTITIGGAFIWWIIDFVLMLLKKQRDNEGNYIK